VIPEKCPRCDRPKPAFYKPTGVWPGPKTDAPIAIAYRCRCGNNRSQYWKAADEPMKALARQVELAGRGMAVRGG
jgi:hypothetical protein